jgi:hypothetical protein
VDVVDREPNDTYIVLDPVFWMTTSFSTSPAVIDPRGPYVVVLVLSESNITLAMVPTLVVTCWSDEKIGTKSLSFLCALCHAKAPAAGVLPGLGRNGCYC